MKKIFLVLSLLLLICTTVFASAFPKTNFSKAILNCDTYRQEGSVKHNNEVFNILITLKKNFNNSCTYKEKIYQDDDYMLLTCTFKKGQMEFISNSMDRFYAELHNEINKNPIFEAKLTTNGEVFQKYLVNKDICQITHSKKK